MDNLEKQLEKQIEPTIEHGDLGVEKKEKTILPETELNLTKKQLETEAAAEKTSGPVTVGEPGINSQASPLHQSIEAILESDLEDLYFKMDAKRQEKFKKKGEATASQIVKLVATGKATFKKIFELIKKWLRLIPGVNKFFIEQEAKIKADKIQNLS